MDGKTIAPYPFNGKIIYRIDNDKATFEMIIIQILTIIV